MHHRKADNIVFFLVHERSTFEKPMVLTGKLSNSNRLSWTKAITCTDSQPEWDFLPILWQWKIATYSWESFQDSGIHSSALWIIFCSTKLREYFYATKTLHSPQSICNMCYFLRSQNLRKLHEMVRFIISSKHQHVRLQKKYPQTHSHSHSTSNCDSAPWNLPLA